MKEINVTYGVMDKASENVIFTPCEKTMVAESGKDERTAIMIKNGDATHIAGLYIENGDGIRSSIGGLLTAIPCGETKLIMLDSMRFKKLSGANCGKFILNLCKNGDKAIAFDGTAASVLMAVIKL